MSVISRARQSKKMLAIKAMSMEASTLEENRLLACSVKYIPEEWRYSKEEAPCHPKRAQITLRIDDDVLKFFKKMGRGYQARVNCVLRMYMLTEMAEYFDDGF